VIANVHDSELRPQTLESDAVVLCTGRRPNDALFHELKAEFRSGALRANGIDALYRVGDCDAPRTIADCVFDGHRLAREIDSEDPSTPLPFLRERSWATVTAQGDLADLASEAVG
jgi:dimethylamine/trimethylamine dehydrogenase